ncbi:MAG: ATP-dependent Clp protease adaptor ClpS [Saprospiraceae bacterium]|nr:ATP-dependent Clp protease adaptor ClpS [Candidatus Opimibacter iunctus]
MLYDSLSKEQEDILVEELTTDGEQTQLIVLNDDYNTFDWVIECFMEVLNHTSEQSEQLAWIVHTKGRASVKLGTLEELKPYKDALTDRGLNAIIEHEKVNR